MANLAKSMQACRHLSLKSFLRIRGAAAARPPSVDSGVRRLGASLRLELIAPSVSFCAKPIRDLPVLKTPLSVQVATMHRPGGGSSPEPLFSARSTGFLTLSKVRQAVLLLETDPDASLIPLVGIWVCVDSAAPDPGGKGSSVAESAVVWAACCRYLHSAVLRERVWVAHNTFLMVTIRPIAFIAHRAYPPAAPLCSQMVVFRNQARFFEVSAGPDAAPEQPSFCCMDFSMDVSAPAGERAVRLLCGASV